MSETGPHEKAKPPTDDQLSAELAHLESILVTKKAHIKGIEDRIAELKKKLGR